METMKRILGEELVNEQLRAFKTSKCYKEYDKLNSDLMIEFGQHMAQFINAIITVSR
jgi:hypothetical protein